MEKNVPSNLLAMTSDNNILYFDKSDKENPHLALWSMESRRVILSSSCDSDISKVCATKNNNHYFIGYQSGKLEKRTSTSLEVHKNFLDLG